MKSRLALIVLGVAVLAAAPMLIIDYHRAHQAKQENDRATFVISCVRLKADAYDRANGHYPDSLNDLSFTNSAQDGEIAVDLSKVSYVRTPKGYLIGWHGTYVHMTAAR